MQPLLISTGVRYFLAVAECESLSAAALKLHVAVSAISRQIAKLEDMFGCPLFDRHARGVQLTEAGERLAKFARAVRLDADRVIEEVRGVAAHGSGIVRVGTVEGLAGGFMPHAMAEFRRKNPGIAIHLHVDAPAEISRLLQQGEIDLAVKYSVEPEPSLDILHQQKAPIVALVSRHHALARRRSVTVAELVTQPLGMPDQRNTVRSAFELCCAQNGLHFEPAFTGNASCLAELAVQGHVVTLGGHVGSAQLISQGDLRAIPIEDQLLKLRTMAILVLKGRHLPSTATAFVQHLATAIKKASPLTGGRSSSGRSPFSAQRSKARLTKSTQSSRIPAR
ncbi:MAG: LysR family transcriptional regulator [Comamonadaceae bacterium]|nr:LysR family transcriptional regulator [Comamonadaceae bacterium]